MSGGNQVTGYSVIWDKRSDSYGDCNPSNDHPIYSEAAYYGGSGMSAVVIDSDSCLVQVLMIGLGILFCVNIICVVYTLMNKGISNKAVYE